MGGVFRMRSFANAQLVLKAHLEFKKTHFRSPEVVENAHFWAKNV